MPPVARFAVVFAGFLWLIACSEAVTPGLECEGLAGLTLPPRRVEVLPWDDARSCGVGEVASRPPPSAHVIRTTTAGVERWEVCPAGSAVADFQSWPGGYLAVRCGNQLWTRTSSGCEGPRALDYGGSMMWGPSGCGSKPALYVKDGYGPWSPLWMDGKRVPEDVRGLQRWGEDFLAMVRRSDAPRRVEAAVAKPSCEGLSFETFASCEQGELLAARVGGPPSEDRVAVWCRDERRVRLFRRVGEGFEVQRFELEPDLVDMFGPDVDEEGRLWLGSGTADGVRLVELTEDGVGREVHRTQGALGIGGRGSPRWMDGALWWVVESDDRVWRARVSTLVEHDTRWSAPDVFTDLPSIFDGRGFDWVLPDRVVSVAALDEEGRRLRSERRARAEGEVAYLRLHPTRGGVVALRARADAVELLDGEGARIDALATPGVTRMVGWNRGEATELALMGAGLWRLRLWEGRAPELETLREDATSDVEVDVRGEELVLVAFGGDGNRNLAWTRQGDALEPLSLPPDLRFSRRPISAADIDDDGDTDLLTSADHDGVLVYFREDGGWTERFGLADVELVGGTTELHPSSIYDDPRQLLTPYHVEWLPTETGPTRVAVSFYGPGPGDLGEPDPGRIWSLPLESLFARRLDGATPLYTQGYLAGDFLDMFRIGQRMFWQGRDGALSSTLMCPSLEAWK